MRLLSSAPALAVGWTLVLAACSSSSGGSGGGNGGVDGGGSDASHSQDSSGGADHSTGADVGASDAGSPDDASADGPHEAAVTCDPPAGQTAACDACIASNCEGAWCACRNDPANVDDAGKSGCEQFVKCAQECVADDAGTPTACLQQICAVAPLTTVEQNEGQNLVGCLVQYCASDCPL
jgi:hypothetical protein